MPLAIVELLDGMNCVNTLRDIHKQHARRSEAAGSKYWTLAEFLEEMGDVFAAVDVDFTFEQVFFEGGTVFHLLSEPFPSLVDRRSRKTFGNGATWADVAIEDFWQSPSPAERAPPVQLLHALDAQSGVIRGRRAPLAESLLRLLALDGADDAERG